MILATSKDAMNATGLGGTGKQEILSVMGGESELERAVDYEVMVDDLTGMPGRS